MRSDAARTVLVAVLGTVLAVAVWVAPDATAASPLRLEPGAVDFGDVGAGSSATRAVVVTNEGDGTVTVTSVAAGGDGFSVAGDSCAGADLAAGDTCWIDVAFAPPAEGAFDGILEVTAADGESATGALAGRGTTSSTTVPATSTTEGPYPTSTVTSNTVGATTTTTAGPSVSTTSTTTVVSGPDDLARLAECEQQARAAAIVYEPKLRLALDETTQVRVVATVADPTTVSVPGPASTVVEVASLRCEVQAQLRGADFDIEPSAFQLGSFLDQPEIVWVWDVVPRRAGDRRLTIEIRSVAEVGGRRIEGAGTRLFESEISVVAPTESLLRSVRRWSESVVDFPLVREAGSLAVLGAGVAAGRRRWRSRRGAAADGPTPKETS